MEKVTADTSVLQDKLEQVKQLMPEVFTENKFDYDKFKGFFAEEIDDRPERYSFTWAGRREAIRLLQAKSRAALIPAKAESVNFDDTKNVFIEGDNLEVLKLLRSSYFNRVKMIYIDPPYNTGNDFIYPDDFKDPLAVYQQITGQKDEQGNVLTTNSETSGRYHSAWLTMMYPRLFIARQLLKEDGVIFISIDDHEVHNLRMIMNEIFGEENFVAVIPWRKRTAKSDVPFGISQDYEWIIVYAKADFFAGIPTNRVYHHTDDYDDGWRLSDLTKQCTKDERPKSFFDMVNPKNGEVFTANPNRVWAVTDNTFDSYYKKGKIVFPGDYSFLNITKPAYRVFEREDKEKNLERFGSEEPLVSISTLLPPDIGRTEDGTKEITGLFGAKVFPFPKPSSLIKYLIQIVNDKNAIVLDFFAGSATTAQAVLELNREDDGNRNFVLVQLPEVGGNGYDTLADISKERIRRVIKMQNGTLPPPPPGCRRTFH